MSISPKHAEQVAVLLNERNHLTVPYTAEKVLAQGDEYLWRLSAAGDVVACVQIKKVQWYQAEVLHLTVSGAELGKGYAKQLLAAAELRAREAGVRLLQCTIREGNVASQRLFQGAGYVKVGAFHNANSGNDVGVFQKVLVAPH